MVTSYPDEIDLASPDIRRLAQAYKMGFANGVPCAESANAAFFALLSRGIVATIAQNMPLTGGGDLNARVAVALAGQIGVALEPMDQRLLSAEMGERLSAALAGDPCLIYPADWAPIMTVTDKAVRCDDCGVGLGFAIEPEMTPKVIAAKTEQIKRAVWAVLWAPHYTKQAA